MEQYKTDAEIYAVLEREIIDLTIRPGSSLSENPLCARFGAPRTLIRVVLQKLQENGLVKIVPYKGTTVTRLNRRIVDELIYERTAVEARVLRDFSPRCTPEQRALIRRRVEAYEALAAMESPDYNKLYEADRKVQRFLSQSFHVAEQFTGMPGQYVPLKETLRGFKMILNGECDDLPESAFLFAGTIDDVFAKAKKG